jgi:hypothetical protein
MQIRAFLYLSDALSFSQKAKSTIVGHKEREDLIEGA